jgi:broad-specificity NMP kinase/DNA-directed RNA polymerase subunit RPC12/RpoP
MINICFKCGENNAEKTVDINGKYAICPVCGYKNQFIPMPLFIVAGASGTGKSTVLKELFGKMDNVILLESDIIWQEEFNKPENNYRQFMETWLRLAKNISQSGRPVVLFGAGLGVPENIEPCIERRYFSKIFYLSLYCSDNELENRLKNRPRWRNCYSEEFIEKQKEFNNWFKQYGKEKKPEIDLIDTTNLKLDESVEKVKYWINEKYAEWIAST